MYMLKSVVSMALVAAYAVAQSSTLQFTSFPANVQAGTQVTLTWTGGDSTQPVTILLKQGDPTNLDTVGTLTTSATGGSYTWNVDSTIVDASNYAFEIQQGTEINYSAPFAVAGGTGVSSTVASASASASVSAASSSASAASASASASASSASASSASASKSSSASKTSATAASTSAPSNSANGLQSPIALLIGAVAAMMYFN